MNFKSNKKLAAVIMLAYILSCTGCSSITDINNTYSASNYTEAASTNTDTSTQNNSSAFTDRDKEIGYDEAESVIITLSDNNIQCSSGDVTIKDNAVTISKTGTYILSGKLTDGQVIIDADKSDKIQLVLNGVNINSNSSAAIYVKQDDKTFITLADGTENTLTNSKEFTADGDTNVDAVIFSKDDVTFNGNGKLTVNSSAGHGIVSKNDLVFTGGNYTITASSHSLSGKDCIKVADGNFTLTSGKDGLHSENTEETDKGYIYIEGGNFTITSDGDGLDASSKIDIKDGTYNITSGGGYENTETKTDNMFPGENKSSSSSESTVSTKGIKALDDLTITNGDININSADDSLHSNSNISISGGTMILSSGDDGIHADASTKVDNGTINIKESYEGIEGQSIDINGGNITLKSSDDGLNAAGGNDESGFGGRGADAFAADDNCYIKITSGNLNIDASGDGIDSNGTLYVSGGEIYLSGPSDGGNGALDYNGDAEISGGIIVATGDSGMAQNFGSSSTQCSMLVTVSSSSINGEVTLSDSSGNKLISFTPEKSYNSVLISCPDIKTGENYTVTANGESTTVEMTETIYGSSNGFNGGGMQGDFNRGNHPPDGNMVEPKIQR